MHPDAPARRITTWLAILGYTLVASGLPLPLGGVAAPDVRDAASARRLAGKDRSRPFPCMDKPCGCDTADRCFTSCCCHTPAETLAWARAHGVESGVLLAIERRVDGGSQPGVRISAVTPKPSCCAAATPRARPSCCSTVPTATAAEHLPGLPRSERQPLATASRATEDVSVSPGIQPHAADEPARQPRSRPVTFRAMLACGGIVAEWFVAGAALPPPRVEVSLAMHLVEERIVADVAGAGLRAAPDAPPPRAA